MRWLHIPLLVLFSNLVARIRFGTRATPGYCFLRPYLQMISVVTTTQAQMSRVFRTSGETHIYYGTRKFCGCTLNKWNSLKPWLHAKTLVLAAGLVARLFCGTRLRQWLHAHPLVLA
jgi:hypothetical protein